MKKFCIVMLSLFIFFSCSKPKSVVEKTILAYEQTSQGVYTDLSMEIQDLVLTKSIYAKDSIAILQQFLKYEQDQIRKSKIDGTSSRMTREIYEAATEYYKDSVFTDSYCERIQKDIDKYERLSDYVLANQYSCTFTIKNPFLNGVKQTMTKTYYISADGLTIFPAL